MDLEPAVKNAAQRIARSLHRFALHKGWKYAPYGDFSQGDYYIDIVANETWLRFDVIFVAKAFDRQDPHLVYDEVQDWLEKELANDPMLVESIDLLIRSPATYREGAGSLGLGDVVVDDDLIRAAIPSNRT